MVAVYRAPQPQTRIPTDQLQMSVDPTESSIRKVLFLVKALKRVSVIPHYSSMQKCFTSTVHESTPPPNHASSLQLRGRQNRHNNRILKAYRAAPENGPWGALHLLRALRRTSSCVPRVSLSDWCKSCL